jgi:hypothetical protein
LKEPGKLPLESLYLYLRANLSIAILKTFKRDAMEEIRVWPWDIQKKILSKLKVIIHTSPWMVNVRMTNQRVLLARVPGELWSQLLTG